MHFLSSIIALKNATHALRLRVRGLNAATCAGDTTQGPPPEAAAVTSFRTLVVNSALG
jgi:hypothetical protein